MLALISIELALTALLSVAFLVVFMSLTPWRSTAAGKLIVAWGVVGVADSLPVLLLAFGVVLHMWIYILIYATPMVVTIWRLVMFIKMYQRGRNDEPQEVPVGEPETLEQGRPPPGPGVPGAGL